MKVAVLGGAGYIGSVLANYLRGKGDEVVVMDCLLYEKDHRKLVSDKFIKGDIRKIDDLLPVISSVDAVVNLAAISNDPASDLKPQITWDVNYKANEMIAELCRSTGKRVIYASSCSVYGFADKGIFRETSKMSPVSLYAHTKMLSEDFFMHKDLDAIILRFATVYGFSPKPRFDLVVNTMIGTSFFDGKIIVNGGEQWRPIVHVKDVAQAIHKVLHKKKHTYRIYNVGSNEQNYKISDLGKIIAKELPKVELVENKHSIDGRSYKVDFSRIKKELGFKPEHSVKSTVKEFYDAFKKGIFKSMEEDEYFRVKYLKRHIYQDTLLKRAIRTYNLGINL